MHEWGTVQRRQHDAGRPRRYAPEDEEEILSHFFEDPTISTNTVANRLGIIQWKVWFTVHSNGGYPYHFTPVQVLHEGWKESVGQWQDESFPNRWIGRGDPIPLPARSPDITPVDFYVLGHIHKGLGIR